MQINAIIKSDAEETLAVMLLNSRNCSNPLFWGKEFKYVIDGKIVEPTGINIPSEFDFFNAWCGKDPIRAREYYAV